MSQTLFIRADAGPTIGIGHFMRMLALAEAWLESGGAVVFGGSVPSSLVQRALALGAQWQPGVDDAASTIARARAANAQIVVADGYHFGLEFQKSIRAAGFKLMMVDDNGENGSYDANWVLNVNIHATEAMYARRSEPCVLLLGTKYVLLRDSIRRQAPARRTVATANRVLVTFGGADPVNATGLVLRALEALPGLEVRVLVGAANSRAAEYQAPNVETFIDLPDVAPVMAWADVAICAPSTTFGELAFLGVPSMLLTLAENQVVIGQRLQALGAARFLGDARSALAVQMLTREIEEFLGSARARAEVVSAARALSEGEGVKRIVAALGRPSLTNHT